jgi:hypothetical protein
VDLIAYWNVIKRRRIIVMVGLWVAACLTLLSLIRVSSDGLAWRSPPIYKATTRLLVTQPGFPIGQATIPLKKPSGGTTTPTPAYDPTRMEYLASLYAAMADSDPISTRVKQSVGGPEAKWGATPVAGAEGRALPLVEIGALGTSPARAIAIANGVAHAMRAFLLTEQGKNATAIRDRAELRVDKKARKAEVFQGVRLTRGTMLFLLMSIVTFAIAFVVDNLRGGRAAAARTAGETPTGLDIVPPLEPERPYTTDADSGIDGAVRIQPPNSRTEELGAETSPAHGRWAARETRLRDRS